MAEEKKKNVGVTVKKDENPSEWYTQVIQKAELAEYTDVSGCMVIRPRAYRIWEKIQDAFNAEIRKLGVQNAYFPMLIPEHLLTREKEHIEGFSPEVAWVTHGGNSKLPERLAIRPTSETIIHDSFSKWIRSYNDLPLKINQWCNIIRWEFKNPVPFLRGREFLWQEGHTAHATRESAVEEVFTILDIYARIFEELAAIPVIKGIKTDAEKFAGADFTTSIETILPSGKSIQAGTSHCLSQDFAKGFNIQFIDRDEQKKLPWLNSWGISTRLLGILVLMHGDDKGLIIPPKLAPVHGVIVPIQSAGAKEIVKIRDSLKEFAIIVDERTQYSPGFKFNDWEMKGVPIRIEIGPKDIAKEEAILVRRDTGEKKAVKLKRIREEFSALLDDIQENMLRKARKRLDSLIVEAADFHAFKKVIQAKKAVKCYFCNEKACEEEIASQVEGVKSMNIPKKQPSMNGKSCVHCSKPAKVEIYFAKSY
ncbi:MAG: proline--tRNA ligase [Nanoarchaeota archaeon]